MTGIIGRKAGMTAMFDAAGKHTACTVIEARPCVITQVKTKDKDGYDALQLGFGERKEKHTTDALKGHFAKKGLAPKRKLIEFRNFEGGKKNVGDTINLEIFNEGEYVDVVGISKGKGFQGVVKRHHFSGVGSRSHGQHDRERAPGSVGASSFPSRVLKGIRMAGRMGGKRVKAQNIQVLKVIKEKNLLIVKGNVPGANGSYVIIQK